MLCTGNAKKNAGPKTWSSLSLPVFHVFTFCPILFFTMTRYVIIIIETPLKSKKYTPLQIKNVLQLLHIPAVAVCGAASI